MVALALPWPGCRAVGGQHGAAGGLVALDEGGLALVLRGDGPTFTLDDPRYSSPSTSWSWAPGRHGAMRSRSVSTRHAWSIGAATPNSLGSMRRAGTGVAAGRRQRRACSASWGGERHRADGSDEVAERLPDVGAVQAALDAVDYLSDLAWPRPCSAPPACASRCCWRVSRGGQDRGGQGPRRGARHPARAPPSATRASTPPRRSTSGTTPASCSASAWPRHRVHPSRSPSSSAAVPDRAAPPPGHRAPRAALCEGCCWSTRSTADDEFEAFLFELLAEAAVTIPSSAPCGPPTRRSCCSPRTAPGTCTPSSGAALPLDRPALAGAGGRHHPPAGRRRRPPWPSRSPPPSTAAGLDLQKPPAWPRPSTGWRC